MINDNRGTKLTCALLYLALSRRLRRNYRIKIQLESENMSIYNKIRSHKKKVHLPEQ